MMPACDMDTYINGVFYMCGQPENHPGPHVDESDFSVVWGSETEYEYRFSLWKDSKYCGGGDLSAISAEEAFEEAEKVIRPHFSREQLKMERRIRTYWEEVAPRFSINFKITD